VCPVLLDALPAGLDGRHCRWLKRGVQLPYVVACDSQFTLDPLDKPDGLVRDGQRTPVGVHNLEKQLVSVLP
jgi:hypothetical protein